ncbi:ATP-binding protein [Kitasatospora kifunensis]|uniref:Anti-sigma regulatory factor (Ser/Thr protein kinase) n=1 Tax=Kitasatospora kifunensis TaxID=58351 RepID=A0A7W7R6T7_KITKI|nr:ATP-binding protein [Kitasatospora kifunensis]MBB4926424.1 anti-sigma regulatory factor (Ser/Thr protein kinase) [Kitasatospora kifunensis]
MERVYRPQSDVFQVTAGADAVRHARDRIVAVAIGWGVPLAPEALGDLRVCASEVVTNALEHAGGECRVTVRWTGRRLLVEVADWSRRAPVMLSPGDELPSGRGLLLVQVLAGGWDWERTERGKVVRFAFATDAAAPTAAVTEPGVPLVAHSR